MVEDTQHDEAQYFERQEHSVFENYDFKDVGIGNPVFPVAQCFQIILDAVLNLIEAIDRQVPRILALYYYEVQQLYRRKNYCCLFSETVESASISNPPHE